MDCDATPARGYAVGMDLGDPASYLVLADGTPVYSSDGRKVGTVEHVLADADADVFDGVIVDMRAGPGGHRFADADQVDAIHERGVVLTVDAAAAEALPEPSGNPASMDAGPEDTLPSDLGDKLRRAWDYLSGRY
jgi:PRC-barrel domain